VAEKRLQVYETPNIVVTFEPNICVHSGVCVRGLPAVFDVSRKRWVRPEFASEDEVSAQVDQCPSGALKYRLKPEAPPSDNHSGRKRLLLKGLTGLVGAIIATLAVRSVALAILDIPPEFLPLAGPGPTIFFTADAAIGAVVVFGVIRRYTERPEPLFRWIALAVLMVSFVPDLWLLSDSGVDAFPGATPTGVGVLMLMHAVAAAVIVWSLTGSTMTGHPIRP
jgi:uncharacterized Fe-S cluster protein YjdI